MSQRTYVYVGGGAAGYFAAINCAEKNPQATHFLLEGTHRPMAKIRISGGGRCNVTHSCFDTRELVGRYPRGSRELLGAFSRFQPKDTIAWFEKRGVQLKTEEDGRMFPTSDKSETIISCLNREAETHGVQIRKGALVKSIQKEERFILMLQNGDRIEADAVLLATGSFPSSYALAQGLGHNIVPPVPSLFTFNVKHALLEDMMGTSFAHTVITMQIRSLEKKTKWVQTGPLLITHWGLSGPAVLKLSAFAARELHAAHYQAQLKVNWTGVENEADILQVLNTQKVQEGKKHVLATPLFEISKRFWHKLVAFSLPDKQEALWSELSKKDLMSLCQSLMASELEVDGKGVFKEEFVSAGGVDLKEVDFKSMESKLCPGLFFAGELLDVDGITGGYNFQNAWTTAWIASQNMGS